MARRRLPILALLILAMAALAFAGPARADSWAPLQRRVYVSANGAWRLVVTPAPAARGRSVRGPAEGRLERRGPGRRWTVQWRRPLVNEIAPAGALIGNDGRYVVTLDNWFSAGHGDHVAVIYDAAGGLVRSFRLTDLVPADYVEALPHSIGSIIWSSETHHFSAAGDSLLLEVATPSERPFDGPGPVTLEVALATGRPVPPSGPAWERALAATVRIRAAQREARAHEAAFLTNPLSGPNGTSWREWEVYLYEAFGRLDPQWLGNSPTISLLGATDPPADAPTWPSPRAALRERPYPGRALMFASPDGALLAAALAEAIRPLRPGRLRGTRVYVAARDAFWPHIAAAFAPTGARLVQIDPGEPIPQPAERLRHFIPDAPTP